MLFDRFDDMRSKGQALKLQTKTVTPDASGFTVTPDVNYNGLSSVVVNGDNDLTPANIKNGVNIFGVTGTYDASSMLPGNRTLVTAFGDISAGDKVSGNVSSSTLPTTISELVVGTEEKTIWNSNFEVGLFPKFYTSGSVSKIFFATSNGYDSVNVTASAVQRYRNRVGVKSDGTLAYQYEPSTHVFNVYEIDKTNKTVQTHTTTVTTYPNPNYDQSAFDARIPSVLIQDYFVLYDTNGFFVYKYNWNTHQVEYVKTVSATTGTYTSILITRILYKSNNEAILLCRNGTNNSGCYVARIIIENNDINIELSQTFTNSLFDIVSATISSDGNYIISSNSTNTLLYNMPSVNALPTLAFTLAIPYGRLLYKNILVADNSIYEITDINNGTYSTVIADASQQVTLMHSSLFPASPDYVTSIIPLNLAKWVASGIRQYKYLPESQTEFTVSTDNSYFITSGKVYGIATETITSGNTGYVNLLYQS